MINFEGLPKTLTDLNQWIPWANVVTELHPAGSKEPRNCHQPKYRSGSTDKNGWGSLQQAKDATKNPEISGVGFCFMSENNMTTIDLDDCLINGAPTDLAKEVLDIFGGKTYVEVSFHGDGLHIEFIGSLPEGYPGGFYRKEDNENSPDIEIYSTGRFMAQTGNRLEGTNPDLTDCQEELNTVLKLYPFKKKTKKAPQLFVTDNTDKISSDFGLTCMSIGPPTGAKPTDTGFKGAHPFHGSKTGMNYFVDTKRDVWYCFHKGHDSGGDAIILYAVKKGIIRCEDAGPGCLEGKWAEVYAALEKDGYKSKKKESELEEGKRFMSELVKADGEKTLDQNIEADRIIARCYFNADDIGEWPEIVHPIFKEWQELGSILSYSRIPYHFASLIPLLSMGINRKACFGIGVLNVYPNLNVMVCGVSTISGKSFANDTAIKTFKDVLIEPDYKNANSDSNNSMVNGTWSHAVVVDEVLLHNNIFWYYDECQQFFEDASGWNAPIIGLMNTAYDCGELERKLSKRNKNKKPEDSIKVPDKCNSEFISSLFNMTLSQLKENCTGKIFKSGFSPRWLYFIETGGEMKKNITLDDPTKARITKIKNEIYEISKYLNKLNPNSVVFNINDKIEEWKISISKKYGGSEYHQTAIGRGFIHIYKLAMILSMYDKKFLEKKVIGKTYPVYVDIPDKWVDEAIKIYQDYLFPRTIKVLEMAKIEDKENKQSVILERLRELHGVATRSQLLRSTEKFILSKELTDILNTLMQAGMICSTEKHNLSSDGRGRKITYYCLVNGKDVEELGKMMDQKLVA